VRDRDGLFSFGADDVLEKPVPPDRLVAVVTERHAAGRRPRHARAAGHRGALA
jgi:hypothetical protein